MTESPAKATDCIFCKISRGEISCQDGISRMTDLFAFNDIAPQAPTRILICPRKHMVSLDDGTVEDSAMLGRALLVAAHLAKGAQG